MLTTARTVIRPLGTGYADLLLDYVIDNREHLAPWEPLRQERYYTLDYCFDLAAAAQLEREQGTEFRFVILDEAELEIIGLCNFTGVVRGTMQSCHLGYSLSHRFQRRGYMTEALPLCLQQMFDRQRLHRVMAAYQPHNTRSAALLQRLGFSEEGLARSYLHIAGQWRDHILTSLINPADVAPGRPLCIRADPK